ncbi:FAD/NAD(P)-binding domain-containing protein [Ophiobolus disseminans]|uniref:FAD/NAD(P)-binding domain-containing protein n=1 Tax=Ophiobolus disseminans TaxID=1469910 RepID=A0A6A6ZYC7_9PLEO|nr:FAD/NAD(P)-binding domain-containing protein [Ophiobolus disseminans]
MPRTASKNLHVLIVGAGTSGLLIAQGLKKASIPFTIFEHESSSTYQSRPREWGMTLHWGSSHLASCLPPHLLARLNEAYADPTQSADATTGLPVFNGETGEQIMEMGAQGPCRVSRRKMRNLFSEGINVRYGMEMVGAEVRGDGRVEVVFGDGTRVLGDVLVGCDGAKSKVRESVVGVEDAGLTDVPISMFNFPYKFEAGLAVRVRGLNPLFSMSIHPESGTMFWLSIQDILGDDPATWTFQILLTFPDATLPPSTDLSTQAARHALFQSRAATYAEPWRSVGLALSPSTPIPLDRASYWSRAAAWDNRSGRMTLCGDAAHPLTPHRGQGLNLALQDAEAYVAAMKSVVDGKGLKEAVDGYDKMVLERGVREMGVSLKQTLDIHDWGTVMESPMAKLGMRRAEE